MLLIAGLGNPGPKYAGHRHNIGFRVADRIATRHAFGPWRSRFKGDLAEGSVATPDGGQVKALLLKPQTFMNESGRAIGEAMKFHKLAASEVVVFYDELDLAPGRLRMKTGGGAAGHNGIRSIIAQAHPDVRRARLGIGHPGDKSLVYGYVLSDFGKLELDWVDAIAEACAKALPFLTTGDDERFQTEVMRLAPAPKGDPRRPSAQDP
ncbi:MAG: aminoacyl-tRNA hydrolase [Alphaproteobacteria bacterium]|nr:aminoacyl-tRNA hydrolase [Alphaproteobacteria bacterium]